MYLTEADFRARTPDRIVPRDDDGNVDSAAIAAATADAESECQVRVPDVLLASDGAPVPAADLAPATLAAVRTAAYNLARAALYDDAEGSKDDVKRRLARADAILDTLSADTPPPDEPEAEIVDGVGGWMDASAPSGAVRVSWGLSEFVAVDTVVALGDQTGDLGNVVQATDLQGDQYLLLPIGRWRLRFALRHAGGRFMVLAGPWIGRSNNPQVLTRAVAAGDRFDWEVIADEPTYVYIVLAPETATLYSGHVILDET